MTGRWAALAVALALVAGCRGGDGATAPPTAATPRPTATARAVDPRAGLPTVSAGAVAVTYAAAGKPVTALFAPVARAPGGLSGRPVIHEVRAGGRAVGGVAVYPVRAELGRSTMFQDQYVNQLLGAVSGKTPTRLVTVQGKVMRLSTGRPAVAGWFENGQAVLLYVTDARTALIDVAQSVARDPRGR